MSHWYHNPFSFFLEELQALTNEGKIEWQGKFTVGSVDGPEYKIYTTLLPKSNCLITIDRIPSSSPARVYIQNDGDGDGDGMNMRTVMLRRDIEVDKSEFDELVKSVVASVILKEEPHASQALEEVKGMWKELRREWQTKDET
jgi:hypothetical protein